MSDRRLRRWAWLGVLASVGLLGAACDEERRFENMPDTGSEWEGRVNEAQETSQFGEDPGLGGAGLYDNPETRISEEVPSPGDEPMPQLDVKPPVQRPGQFDAELQQQRKPGPSGAIGAQPGQAPPGSPTQPGLPPPGVPGGRGVRESYPVPQETGTEGTGVTSGEEFQEGGVGAPGPRGDFRGVELPDEAAPEEDKASDLGEGTPLGR